MPWRTASELSRLCPKHPERLVHPDAQDAIFFFPDVGQLPPPPPDEFQTQLSAAASSDLGWLSTHISDMSSGRSACLTDPECQGRCRPDEGCQGICLLNVVHILLMQNVKANFFQTQSVKANVIWMM